MVLRGNRRLRSITNVEDVHRVVTIAAVSNAFRAWYTLFDSLAISTDTARYLHQNEHGLHNDDDDDWAASSSASFTYGEVDFFGLASLLAAVRPRPGQTFCDLGHGTGRAVFAAALLYPELRVLGIELVPSLFQASRRAFRAFPCHHHEHSIQLVHGDILHVDWWSGCDFVWVNATAFSATLWNHVQTLALRLQPGAIFVCLTQVHAHLVHVLACYWGLCGGDISKHGLAVISSYFILLIVYYCTMGLELVGELILLFLLFCVDLGERHVFSFYILMFNIQVL
ncbi:hypothetical protein, variant 1 [Aphanomyces astaci]|nr:hypothetical protein, variant 1 [Aphanomyces astaci]ETV66252.1 hypothetical protein, variant 1 [Aphanomyces astaci]|eukprot:XP_009844245.1 hypothetical protein, variant 1 [Aphanomyces astaci]